MTSPRRDRRTRRRVGSTNEDELLAARRMVSDAERRAIEEAERRRAEADTVLADARAEAERILEEARAVAAGVAPAQGADDGGVLERDGREAALSAVDPSADDLAVLHRLLRDDLSADVRLAAVEALARAPEVDQLEALAVALADPEPAVRAGAVRALPAACTPRAAPRLMAAAEDHHESVRAAAYRRLASSPSWVLWMALGRCSHRSELLAVLLAEHQGVGALVRERLSSPDAADRVLALELTPHVGDGVLLAEAVDALADEEPVVRLAAATRLGRSDVAVPGLVAALADDPDPAVCRAAARALAGVGDEGVLLALVGALQDPDSDVRRVAVGALREHPSPALADLLVADLTTSNLDSVGEALVGMGPIGEQALAAAAAAGPPARAAAAAELLARKN